MLKIGQIVKSAAGHDQGKYYAVVGMCENGVMIANGKARKLAKPKAKNTLHVKKTNTVLSPEALTTDKQLRKAIAKYRGENADYRNDTEINGGS